MNYKEQPVCCSVSSVCLILQGSGSLIFSLSSLINSDFADFSSSWCSDARLHLWTDGNIPALVNYWMCDCWEELHWTWISVWKKQICWNQRGIKCCIFVNHYDTILNHCLTSRIKWITAPSCLRNRSQLLYLNYLYLYKYITQREKINKM